MFYRYLDRSKVYFEWGSGGSTYQASIRRNIQQIYSVESDLSWHTTLKAKIPRNANIEYLYADINTQPNTFGYPGGTCKVAQMREYSDKLLKRYAADLVLINGRFRVACCLKAFNEIGSECLVAFDDFLDRPQYHIVLDYYDMIESTSDNSMAILRKKPDIPLIESRVRMAYETSPD